jgi:multidrug resistance efflux pump
MAIANQALQSVQGTITEHDAKSLEVAHAEVAAAEADVALAELLVANMEIRAPFAGTVAPLSSDVVPGGWVTAGTSIIVLQEVSK